MASWSKSPDPGNRELLSCALATRVSGEHFRRKVDRLYVRSQWRYRVDGVAREKDGIGCWLVESDLGTCEKEAGQKYEANSKVTQRKPQDVQIEKKGYIP
jgi:hypothetical protein